MAQILSHLYFIDTLFTLRKNKIMNHDLPGVFSKYNY